MVLVILGVERVAPLAPTLMLVSLTPHTRAQPVKVGNSFPQLAQVELDVTTSSSPESCPELSTLKVPRKPAICLRPLLEELNLEVGKRADSPPPRSLHNRLRLRHLLVCVCEVKDDPAQAISAFPLQPQAHSSGPKLLECRVKVDPIQAIFALPLEPQAHFSSPRLHQCRVKVDPTQAIFAFPLRPQAHSSSPKLRECRVKADPTPAIFPFPLQPEENCCRNVLLPAMAWTSNSVAPPNWST